MGHRDGEVMTCQPYGEGLKRPSGMGEDVDLGPAQEIEARAGRQEVEAGLGQLGAALAGQHRVEPVLQGMQVQHVGGRVIDLGLAQGVGAPVGGLLLLGEVDAEPAPATRSFSPCRSV